MSTSLGGVAALKTGLSSMLGSTLRVRTIDDCNDADLIVVQPPEWTRLWRWRSSCGRLLSATHLPVAIAAPASRPPRSCLIAVAPHEIASDPLPEWISSFERVELALCLDASHFSMSVGGTPFPSAILGPGYGISAAQTHAERVALGCIARLGDVRVSHHLGQVESAIAEIARARHVDVVFLANARQMLFLGTTLKHLVATLGLSVIVPPPRARAPYSMSLAAVP